MDYSTGILACSKVLPIFLFIFFVVKVKKKSECPQLYENVMPIN